MKNFLVISEDPSFGAAANLVHALRQQGNQVRAVFKNKDPKGFWKTVENAIYPPEKMSIIIRNNQTILVGSNSYEWFKQIGYLPEKFTVVLTDTHYIRNHQRLNEEFTKAGATVFAMPDLYQYRKGLPTLPYYPPFQIEEFAVTKNEHFTVCHSPGPKAKTNLKGTLDIRKAMAEFCQKYPDVEYMELTGLSHEETLRQKAKAHVFIDQIVPKGKVPFDYEGGLGKSGIEAMLLGCCVITSGNHFWQHEIGHDPSIRVPLSTLNIMLEIYYQDPEIPKEHGRTSKAWATEYTSYEHVANHIQQTTENVPQ